MFISSELCLQEKISQWNLDGQLEKSKASRSLFVCLQAFQLDFFWNVYYKRQGSKPNSTESVSTRNRPFSRPDISVSLSD